MEVKPFQVSVREIFDGYLNDEESGQVVAFGGKLNVRPAYQREFVYNAEQQEAVMRTILNDFPLNVIYWSDNGDGTYEMIDGQQRTLSFCEWLNNGFSIFANPNAPEMPYYAHTSEVIKERVLNYKLMVYICKGTDVEKLEWFKVINIAGEKLNDQELRNAVYTGQWLADAKQFFSKRNCIAYKLGEKYLTGSPIRQEYLESVLYWISSAIGMTIEELMARHQGDASATPLKDYYRGMINWIEQTFPNYRKLMRGIEWGLLFNDYGFRTYNPEELEKQISELLLDEDVTRQKGIYEYVLSGKTREKALSIRQFSENDRRRMYERQQGICPLCEKEGRGVKLELSEMHADHKIPWSRGGHTTLEKRLASLPTTQSGKIG